MNYRRLWIAFGLVTGLSFAVLLFYGGEIYRKAPPVPERVVTTDGEIVATGRQIRDGQNVWQSTGGQELGSVWGHGAYVAPDWSAEWLHLEAVLLLDALAREEGAAGYDDLDAGGRAALRARLEDELRTNRYDPETGDLTISPRRAAVFRELSKHYAGLFSDDLIRLAFWCMNIGLALMVLISVLPVGLAQAVASMEHGLWYARSAEFLQDPTLGFFRWLRVVGDSIFAVGVLALAWFVLGLQTGWSVRAEVDVSEESWPKVRREPGVPVGD